MLVDPKQIASELPKHVHFAHDRWDVSLWTREQLTQSSTKGWEGKALDEYHKILNERRETTHQPIKRELKDNVVLNVGLQKIIDLLINASSDRLDYCSLGTSATTELVTQTNLQSEDSGGSYARKQFSATGSTRSRTEQTMLLETVWADTNVSSVPKTFYEAGVHWGSSGTSNCYSRVTFSGFQLQTDYLFVVTIRETHQNGTL